MPGHCHELSASRNSVPVLAHWKRKPNELETPCGIATGRRRHPAPVLPAPFRHNIAWVALSTTVSKVLETAKKLKGAGGNEANTKALLIEPLLAALGWDTADLDQVEREYRVFDGTSLDYALKINGDLRLFLEAKAVGKGLDDKAFIFQTVNYANNEGIVWCVLTNGLSYRVYKTNEPVNMEEKLLFEVDLTEADQGSASEVAKSLELLSRDSLANASLEAWGEQVFTDKRVRNALVYPGREAANEDGCQMNAEIFACWSWPMERTPVSNRGTSNST